MLLYLADKWFASAHHRVSHVSAKCFNRVVYGLELGIRHPWIMEALKGFARSHAEAGTPTRVRRPLAWGVILQAQLICGTWGAGGRVLWLAVSASFVSVTRAGKMFISREGHWHNKHCLRRGGRGVLSWYDNTQLDWTSWGRTCRVEVPFWSSKEDQCGYGVVLKRKRTGAPLPLMGGGGGGRNLVFVFALPPHAPLAAVGTARGRWSVLVQSRATAALRDVVAAAGTRCTHFIWGAPPFCRHRELQLT